MATHPAALDLMVRIRLAPEIIRVFWSARRAWPGNVVKLCVETRHVPDGTQVSLDIRSAALGLDGPSVQELSGLEIKNGRCVVEHTLLWDSKIVSEIFGRGDLACNFVAIARIGDYELEATSAALYVALDPFVPSF